MQQQCRELHVRLPTAGELTDRTVEIRSLQLELAGHLAAFPVGLAAVAIKNSSDVSPGRNGIVLPQVADLKLRALRDFPFVEFLFVEQHEQRTLAGSVATDEPDLHVVVEGDVCRVEQDLIAVALVSVLHLQQHTHRTELPAKRKIQKAK